MATYTECVKTHLGERVKRLMGERGSPATYVGDRSESMEELITDILYTLIMEQMPVRRMASFLKIKILQAK